MVQTVCGKVLPESLGHFQIHEHIWVHHTPLADKNPALLIDSPEVAEEYLTTPPTFDFSQIFWCKSDEF